MRTTYGALKESLGPTSVDSGSVEIEWSQSIDLFYKAPQVQIRLKTTRTRGRIFHLSFGSLA